MKVDIFPQKKVVAGSTNMWTLKFELDDCEIQEGGGLRVQTPGGVGWSRPQIQGRSSTGGELDGLVSAVCSDASVKLEISVAHIDDFDFQFNPWGEGWSNRWVYIKPQNASIKKGSSITLYYGDARWNASAGARAGIRAGVAKFKTWIDCKGNGNFERVDGSPVLDICPAEALKMSVIGPSKISLGETCDFVVKITDIWNNPVDFEVEYLEVEADAGDYIIEQEQKSSCYIKKCIFKTPGIKHINVFDRKNKLQASSSPVFVDGAKGASKIYWGEMHSHSNLSFDVRERVDEDSSPARCYKYARDVNRLDFAALADHNFFRKLGNGIFLGRFDEKGKMCGHTALSESEWREAKKIASEYNLPGKFIAFSGYEFRSEHDGDVCIYFKDDNADNFLDHTTMGKDDLEDLYKFHEEDEIMAVPHLMLRPWRLYPNTPQMPLIEIFSIFGCFEYEGNPLQREGRNLKGCSVQDYLIKGYRFGFNAGSDDHEGYPGIMGITGVLAEKLDRDSLWNAFMNRNTYATTGARIYLDFRINDQIMGSEIALSNEDHKRKIKVSCAGVEKIKKVEILRNNEVICEREGGAGEISFEFDDLDEIESVRINSLLDSNLLFYYVRVTQEDGHMAWASPIWIK